MDKMKKEKDSNKRMLLEMGGLVKALQDISVDYERQGDAVSSSAAGGGGDPSSTATALNNVQRKIQAIDKQMKQTREQCGMLQEEKTIQSGTIKAQESQIKSMGDQIQFLVDRLHHQTHATSKEQNELEKIIQLQETQIHSLEGQIDLLKVNQLERAEKEKEIQALAEMNAAKYAEIGNLERKLAALREAQNAHQNQASLLKNQQEQEGHELSDQYDDGYTAADTSEDTPHPVEQQTEDAEQPPPSPQAQQRTVQAKKQPVLVSQPIVRSARKKKSRSFLSSHSSVGGGSISGGSSCKLEAIAEDGESLYDGQSNSGRDGYSAMTPAALLGISSRERQDSSESTHSSCSSSSQSSSESESSSTSSSSSSSSSPTTSSSGRKFIPSTQRTIQLVPSEDGSVEVMSMSPDIEKPDAELVSSSMPQDDSSATSSSGWSSRSSRTPASAMNDQNPENDFKSEWETVSDVHSGGSDQNPNKMHLLEQLDDARTKYDKLQVDYTSVVANSRKQIDELEKENRKLRSSQGLALSSMAQVSEANNEASKLKEENETLRKELEKQQALMTLSSAKYETLRMEHSYTVQELQSKTSRYEQLVQDYSDVAYRIQDAEDYRQLEQIHNTVVMKLADMGEDNENLQKEKDLVTEQLNKAYSELQAYDETVLGLEKMKTSYSRLEEKHRSTALHLEQLTEHHERVKVRLIEEISMKTPEDHEKLQQDYAEAMARIEILEKSNEELADMDAKLNASEVRATMLEVDMDQTNKKLMEAKKKQEEREIQLKEVIAQYKSLKREHEDMKTKYERLKAVVDNDKRTSIVGAAKNIPDSHNNNDTDSATPKSAAMTAKIVAYEGQITKLQQQRDAALEQMKALEADLDKAKKESSEALEAKQSREKDLKIVLQHYEKLQKKYEVTSQQLEDIVRKYEETVRKIDMVEQSIHISRTGAREIESLPNWITNEDDQQSKTGAHQERNESNCASTILSDEVSVGIIESPHDEIDSTQRSSTSVSKNQGVGDSFENHRLDDNVDDGSIAQLLMDMEHLKRQNAERTTKSKETEGQQKDGSFVVTQAESHRQRMGDSSSLAGRSEEATSATADGLEYAKEMSAWKDNKIARVLCELKISQELVEQLKSEKCQLEEELSTLQSQVLLAKLETSKAEERHSSRETHLRTAIANHHRLQQAYESLNAKFEKVQHELVQAQKETKIKEEEAKGVRKRASAVHAQYKKLQTDHNAVLERQEKLEQELIVYMEASLCVEQQEY